MLRKAYETGALTALSRFKIAFIQSTNEQGNIISAIPGQGGLDRLKKIFTPFQQTPMPGMPPSNQMAGLIGGPVGALLGKLGNLMAGAAAYNPAINPSAGGAVSSPTPAAAPAAAPASAGQAALGPRGTM
jgi:hypothetical protein